MVKRSLFIILSILSLFLLLPNKVFASSYNYDKNNDKINVPSAYYLSRYLDLNSILPSTYKDKNIKILEIAKSPDEIFLLGNEYISNKKETIIIVLDRNLNYKFVIKDSNKLKLPLEAKTFCYTDNKLYISSGKDIVKFNANLINPITKEILIKEDEILTKELENNYEEVLAKLSGDSKDKLVKDFKDLKRSEREIYIYNRYKNNKLRPSENPLEYVEKFGLLLEDAKVLKSPFRPEKIKSNDKTEMLYVISQDSEMGILSFRKDGTFIKYIGTNKIELTLKEKIWRRLTSSELLDEKDQKRQLNFSDMAVDNKGFIFTITPASKNNPIQRFNQAGENVLGVSAKNIPKGDYHQMSYEEKDIVKTSFDLISVSDFKTYVAFDKENGKIFSYNNDGELMFVYSSSFSERDLLTGVRDILMIDEDIYILENDNFKNTLKILSPTEYGKLLNDSSKNYAMGNYDKSYDIYKEILKYNSNSEYAYNGLGKIYLLKKDYENATKAFKKANNGNLYLEAYEESRKNKMAGAIFLVVSIILLCVSFSVSVKKIKSDKKVENEQKRKGN